VTAPLLDVRNLTVTFTCARSTRENVLAFPRERMRQARRDMQIVLQDLRLVQHICRRVVVRYLGWFVETGDTTALFENPAHPCITLDQGSFNPEAPLRAVGTSHLAAA
jgi:ABC-type glutathione transport system ATPase component